MSSTVGPEDRTPRRGEDGTSSQDGRIHDARQDAVSSEPIRDEPARGGRTDDTRAFPAAPAAATSRMDTPVSSEKNLPAAPARGHRTDADPGEIPTRETVVAREKEQFGGIQVGSAFFGWLAATGTAVLLTALVAAAGTAVGLATNTDVNEAVNSGNETVGLVGVIALLVILFVAYYCGGYVAGRMARFNGAKQGFMVWVWAIIAAVVVAILGLVAGQQFNILANLNSFPRIPVNEGQLNTMSIIAAVVIAVVALIGAVLGGLAGMHFHRKVDRAGFTPADTQDR
ncbi:MAG: hypothetical protein JWM13_1317 [Arthrobacter sp.]|jgi:hypothetical protein|nr:hypothetical protein [Arthrobacter sp.]MCU1553831.1 hypothetical protein [Arthrobacter sp.]